MIARYFYMHSKAWIKENFPNACFDGEEKEFVLSEECGIAGGWNHKMADMANRIDRITRENSNETVELENSIWSYDIRLGDILEVDTKKRSDCYFLDQYEKGKYRILDHYTSTSVGGIINRPPPPSPSKKSRLAGLLAGRKENSHGIMALSD